MLKLKYAVSLIAAMAMSAALYAQNQTDTLTLKFQDAEKRFLENNFSLIAQRYNVDASKASIQAKFNDLLNQQNCDMEFDFVHLHNLIEQNRVFHYNTIVKY